MIFQKSSCSLGGSSIFEGRRVILETQNRPEETPGEEKTTTSKKIEREEPRRRTTRAPKMSPRWFLGSREAPKRPPRAFQRSPEGSQETPKSAQKMSKRAPRHFQDHLRIEDIYFSKIELPPRRELGFRGSEGNIGILNSASRTSRRGKDDVEENKKQRSSK